jgi:hypothetical protein
MIFDKRREMINSSSEIEFVMKDVRLIITQSKHSPEGKLNLQIRGDVY